mgnify:CR=1 FL=1
MTERYNSSQMLDLCKVNAFHQPHNNTYKLVTKLLALITLETDSNTLIEKMSETIENSGEISIGRALDKLVNIANLGDELDYGKTGIDALSYHLSIDTCQQSVEALQKVIKNYERV